MILLSWRNNISNDFRGYCKGAHWFEQVFWVLFSKQLTVVLVWKRIKFIAFKTTNCYKIDGSLCNAWQIVKKQQVRNHGLQLICWRLVWFGEVSGIIDVEDWWIKLWLLWFSSVSQSQSFVLQFLSEQQSLENTQIRSKALKKHFEKSQLNMRKRLNLMSLYTYV